MVVKNRIVMVIVKVQFGLIIKVLFLQQTRMIQINIKHFHVTL